MKKFLTLAALILATPIITQHNEALAVTLGPLPRDVIYSSDGTFDRPNIFFNNPTDTLQISGQTVLGNESTYEARIYFPRGIGTGGFVFNEWTGGYEDKGLAAGLNALIGANFPFYPGTPLASLTTLVSDTWHHIAFVQGGGSQRLYLDGQMVGTRPAAGDIWGSNGGGFIGALFRDGSTASSFIGHLDTLRISNVARYSGNSFEAPTGDIASDANTQILYNFNLENYYQQDGFTWASDLSGNGRNGRFGTGFAGATSPSVIVPVEPSEPVPEPTTVLGTLAFGAVMSRWRMKRKQQQKVLNSTVS